MAGSLHVHGDVHEIGSALPGGERCEVYHVVISTSPVAGIALLAICPWSMLTHQLLCMCSVKVYNVKYMQLAQLCPVVASICFLAGIVSRQLLQSLPKVQFLCMHIMTV